MERVLLSTLLSWKAKSERKPLLIDGARQTGKTYLLQELFGRHFDQVLRIDFLESPAMAEAFAGSLTPSDVLSSLELLIEKAFNPDTDLLILKEVFWSGLRRLRAFTPTWCWGMYEISASIQGKWMRAC